MYGAAAGVVSRTLSDVISRENTPAAPVKVWRRPEPSKGESGCKPRFIREISDMVDIWV